MRSLIRPALFLVARLCLFVSVVGWAVGQWWVISVQRPWAGDLLQLRVSDNGWSLLQGMPRLHKETELNAFFAEADLAAPSWRFGEPLIGPDGKPQVNVWYESQERVPGIVYAKMTWGTSRSIAVRHWLLLVASGLYYGVLKFVYRRSTAISDQRHD